MNSTRILKLPAVMEATQLSRSSIYAFAKKGQFPAPVRLGENSVGWLSEEIEGWIAERATQRPNTSSNVGGVAR